MATVITALIVPGFIALIIALLVLVHKRDQKRAAAQKTNTP